MPSRYFSVLAFALACASGQPVTKSEPDAGALPTLDAKAPPPSDAQANPDAGLCKVSPETDNAPICTVSAPPGSFTPKLKWSYIAPPKQGPGFGGVQVIPLVGNFTDDNGDGQVDL